MQSLPTRLLPLLSLLALAACPTSDGDDPPAETTSGSATDTDPSTPSGEADTSGDGDSGSEGDTSGDDEGSEDEGDETAGDTTAGDGTGGGGGGTCVQSCAEPADCCPDGVPNCPGKYPFNFECNAGVCEPGGCDSNETCEAVVPGWVCVNNGDASACAVPCTDDAECLVDGFSCTGVDDNDVTYCAPEDSGGCTSDDDCTGFGTCDGGSCVCSDDGDCTADGVDTCRE